MTDQLQLHCPDCGHDMALPVQRCPHCSQIMSVRGRGRRSSMSPIIVVLLLFLVLGPFGFGLLWRNDRFELPWKIALTVIVTIYTVVVVWWAYAGMNHALDAIVGSSGGADLDKALQQLQ